MAAGTATVSGLFRSCKAASLRLDLGEIEEGEAAGRHCWHSTCVQRNINLIVCQRPTSPQFCLTTGASFVPYLFLAIRTNGHRTFVHFRVG